MGYSIPSTGSLRESVRIERQVLTPDGGGGSTSKWSIILAGLPARITPVSGNEKLLAQGLQAVAIYQITVRGSSDTLTILESDRIVNERTGTVFNIRFIQNPDERGRFLEITSERGVAT